MGPTWDPDGADRIQVGPTRAPCNCFLGSLHINVGNLWKQKRPKESFYHYDLTLIPAWISTHVPSKDRNGITNTCSQPSAVVPLMFWNGQGISPNSLLWMQLLLLSVLGYSNWPRHDLRWSGLCCHSGTAHVVTVGRYIGVDSEWTVWFPFIQDYMRVENTNEQWYFSIVNITRGWSRERDSTFFQVSRQKDSAEPWIDL